MKIRKNRKKGKKRKIGGKKEKKELCVCTCAAAVLAKENDVNSV